MSEIGHNSGMLFLDDLFEVQRRALLEAGDKDGYAYFLEQGLGKTRVVLYEFHDKVNRDLCDVLFMVVPRSLRGGWRDEHDEIGLKYPVILVESDKKTYARLNELDKQRRRQPVVIVCHYEQVQTHGLRILEKLLLNNRRIYLGLDESVRIKKHSSVIGDVLVNIANGKKWVRLTAKKRELRDGDYPAVPFRRVLSGTPAPQGPHDLWNQFRFLGKMFKTPYFAFRNMYCKMGGYMGNQILGAQNLDILRIRTGDFAFRAKKVDWTDLPAKLNALPREVELTPEQKRAYLEVMHDFVIEFGPDDFLTVEMAITVKGKLQQICSGWVYDNEKQVREIVPLDRNPKLNEAADLVNDIIPAGKIIVFFFFRPTRAYLAQLAEREGWGHIFLEGKDENGKKIGDEEFDRRKREFNTNDDIKVAFCQIDSVKEGHTLLGTKNFPCHNTLFLENTYSLYARSQGEDRNHRHGQKYPVTYHDIVTSKEDKAIIKALQRKGNLQEAILSEFTAYREGKDVTEIN